MKNGLRLKVFIPVLFLLILLPITCWLIFASVSGNYLTALSQKELRDLTGNIAELTARTVKGEREDAGDWPDQVKELLQDIKACLRANDSQADVLIFSSRKKLIYPKTENIAPPLTDFYQYCLEGLQEEAASGVFSDGAKIQVGKNYYLTELIEIPGEENLRAKYLIVYVPVPDYTVMLAASGRLVFFITAAMALLSLLIVWIVAGHLARPLKLLCRHTEQIARRKFEPLNQSFSVREMEELRLSINQMSGQLARSEEVQNSFFQNVSHELRTPLMSICGYAQGIEQGIFPEPEKAAGIIADESLRMKELVDSILTISRLDNENIRLNPCSISLRDFLEEALERLEGGAASQGISMNLCMPEEDIFISVDTSLFSRSLQNILSNCLRYAKSRVDVTVPAPSGIPAGSSFAEPEGAAAPPSPACRNLEWDISIQIKDDGPGISEADLPHIFERFYKGTNGKFGIGLSLARSSLEYMGGRLEAGNDNGAVFILRIRNISVEQPSSPPAAR